jgi:hypothetical protein
MGEKAQLELKLNKAESELSDFKQKMAAEINQKNDGKSSLNNGIFFNQF